MHCKLAPEMTIDEYTFSADKQKLDLQYIFNLLCIPSQYSTGLPPERFPLVIQHSVCFCILHENKQVGFARVVTDFSEFASLWDVFVDEAHRGKGLGKMMMKYVLEHPHLRGVFRWFLMTENAHGLYRKFGFKTETGNPWVMMRVAGS
ncbi:MAG: GNAT family N-acetyltransferase [Gammaproteobacteria bacterium]|nr:GNAT family N-acetyltransferase [Gammaproteobacteria bacterium]